MIFDNSKATEVRGLQKVSNYLHQCERTLTYYTFDLYIITAV